MDFGAGSPPHFILGYNIRSPTFVYVYYIIPSILGLFVYICQIIADCAVSYQHFISKQPEYGCVTIIFILTTPILTIIFVLRSKDRSKESSTFSKSIKFFIYQFMKLIFFPFFVIYRFSIQIFWSIEALFQKNERNCLICLEKTEKCSAFAIYNFIQAYAQSAPQITLQLYYMLKHNDFRNIQTTHAQSISLVFSLINLAAITTVYQRFESQKKVGRLYLWSTSKKLEEKTKILESIKRLRKQSENEKRESKRKITIFQESDKIMENFQQHSNLFENNECISTIPSQSQNVKNIDEVDTTTQILLHNHPSSIQNVTDDEKIKTKPLFKLPNIQDEVIICDNIEINNDTIPESPAPSPPPPVHTEDKMPLQSNVNKKIPNRQNYNAICLLKILKDMLIINIQLYIKEKIPHPPKSFVNRINNYDIEKESYIRDPANPETDFLPLHKSTQDDVDFFLPRPLKIINGIYQDDIAAGIIAFFGWISFILMRMLSIVSFCVFFPKSFFIIIISHYLLMLFSLLLESHFRVNLKQIFFKFILAYIYIFVLIEFRIKFKRIRIWYIGYLLLTMIENITMTTYWYSSGKFESWWFSFITEGIVYSGLLFIITLIVYYCVLKPKDVALIVNANDINST